MNKQRLGILIAAAVGMLATFLPWINTFMGSVAGSSGDGWISFGLFAIVLILVLTGDKKTRLAGKKFIASLVMAVLAGALGIWKIVDFKSSMSEAMGGDPFSEALGAGFSIGMGLYLMVLAAIAVLVIGFIIKPASPATPPSTPPTTPPAPQK